MDKKSDLWDIDATVNVTFERVSFKKEVTEEEAMELFKNSDFDHYNQMVENGILEITGAEIY